MNQVEFQNLCNAFFEKEDLSLANIEKSCKEKSVDDFQTWYLEVVNQYFEQTNPEMLKVVKYLRGDFDCFKDDSELDPLKKEENKVIFTQYKDISNNTINEKFLQLDCIKSRNEEWFKVLRQKQLDDALKITVENKNYVAIDMCEVLWSGWECDANAWIVEDEGKKKLVTSNHGSLYFEDASFLENKIKEYEAAIEKSKEMLALLKK
jgi:hypothetical protein